MLQLGKRELERIYKQAADEYPAECCGVLSRASGEENARVHRCENIQDRLHAEDPENHPRDARIAYYMEPQELYDIISAAEKRGGSVAGFYHSHIDCDAYFSAEDKERAMVWDEPAYPDAVYLVVSVYERTLRGYKCFSWDEDARDFVEVELAVAE